MDSKIRWTREVGAYGQNEMSVRIFEIYDWWAIFWCTYTLYPDGPLGVREKANIFKPHMRLPACLPSGLAVDHVPCHEHPEREAGKIEF